MIIEFGTETVLGKFRWGVIASWNPMILDRVDRIAKGYLQELCLEDL